MSLSAILNNANSGLTAAQTQLRVISDNVANVNTPGYIRKIAEQQSLTSGGIGSGVEVGRIRLATDRFLQAAGLNAGAEAGRQEVRYELYDRIQSLFGDPGGDSGFFARVDGVFSSFAATAEDAASSPRRQDALFKAEALFDDAARISGQIQASREDADGRIQTAVERANGLISQIDALNVEIARSTAIDADATGAQGTQAKLVRELGTLLDMQVIPSSTGGVSIRTGGGALLVGPGAAKLDYQRAGRVGAETAFNEIWITEPGGQKRGLTDLLSSGEIKGLIELRDVDAPQTAERFAELLSGVADELNRAHNANSSVPPPATLTGRNIGQDLTTAVSGFAGTTTIAITNAAGVVQADTRITFSAGGVSFDGGPVTPHADFLTNLNAQISPSGTASFVNGKLSIAASTGNGAVIADDPTAPAKNRTDRGFSHFFGLNDLIVADRPAIFETGLVGSSSHGFPAGQTVDFRLTNDNGAKIRDVTFTVPAGGTMDDLRLALNNPVTGLGRYGTFALDAKGVLTFTGSGSPPTRMTALQDTTNQTSSGLSMTELFGIGGGARASRADSFAVRSDIQLNSGKLALARFNLNAAAGTPALSVGDGRGALALADAGNRETIFQGAGGVATAMQTVSRYAATLSGDIGGNAAAAKTRADSSAAIQTEADARQNAYEGVNLDEELVLLTTYQQAFNASARLIQAARDVYDILLGMV